MKKEKNILIFGATSDMASALIEKLLASCVNVYAVSRGELNFEHPNLFKFRCDLSLKEDICTLFKKMPEILFDNVVIFHGLAISSPVELLEEKELERQLNVSLFSHLTILKNLNNKISKNGSIVSLSSMASFGIFPFLAPYSIAKASCDMLLNCYEIETGIKTVSVKAGVVGTKFWKFCVNENKRNFEAFSGKYETIGKFLEDNALKNANKGISPNKVANLVYKILNSKRPRASYTIGRDSFFSSIIANFKGRSLFYVIRKILNMRVERFLNER